MKQTRTLATFSDAEVAGRLSLIRSEQETTPHDHADCRRCSLDRAEAQAIEEQRYRAEYGS